MAMIQYMIIILMLTLIIMLLALFLSSKSFNDREKNSPFECGFEPFNSSRLPFSLHFFLIAIIFLIFDVEIALILPMVYSMKINNLVNWSMLMIFIILILILGLFHEWNEGALEWNN